MTYKKNNKPPLFIVAGMPRGATTFLYHYLSQHPDIYLPFRKEVNYFNSNFEKGEAWYHSLYSEMKDELIAGDISPPYFLDEHSITRIKQYGNSAKIILVIREPAEWAISFYHQFKSFNFNVPSLEDYLVNGYSCKIGDQYLSVNFSSNWISDRINQFRDEFGDNILIYDFAYFKKNPLVILQQIEVFLEVSSHFSEANFDNRRINDSKRRNVRLISWLLSREKIIGLLAWAFPRKIITFFRAVFDRFSAKTAGDSSKLSSHDEQEMLLAMKYLGEEVENINILFKDGPVLAKHMSKDHHLVKT